MTDFYGIYENNFENVDLLAKGREIKVVLDRLIEKAPLFPIYRIHRHRLRIALRENKEEELKELIQNYSYLIEQ